MRIAVIGAGVTGLGAAWLLHRAGHDVTVFEQAERAGGHANTVDAPGPAGATIGVDTGFMVYNEPAYPNLTALLAHLEVPTDRSNMSFSVSLGRGRLEYAGRNLAGMYAQKRNLLSPTYALMLRDILRFHKEAPALLDGGLDASMTLGEYLVAHHYGNRFIYDHLLPMAAGIWSATVAEVLSFPAQGCIRFLDNHGLLKGRKRPPWRTVIGGSRAYVRRLMAAMPGRVQTGRAISLVRRVGNAVEIRDAGGPSAEFDQLIIATHADQALALLADPSDEERKLLGAFSYHMNRAVLHRDPALMPKRPKTWSSWNYVASSTRDRHARVSVTYWMNLLQNLDRSSPLFVTLNPIVEPRPGLKLREFIYDQPVLDAAAIAAQGQLGRIQGVRRTWFCGAWCGYGFHEDGLTAGLAVAEALGARRPWPVRDLSPAGRNVRPPGHKLTPADGN
jgi:predicted NAD/FAD-binding protein